MAAGGYVIANHLADRLGLFPAEQFYPHKSDGAIRFRLRAGAPINRMANNPESRQELIEYLEQVSGRRIRTREDIKAYLDEVAARKAADEPSVRRWQQAKTITLIGLATFAFVQYYMMDVMVQILSLRETTVFVPVSAPMVKS